MRSREVRPLSGVTKGVASSVMDVNATRRCLSVGMQGRTSRPLLERDLQPETSRWVSAGGRGSVCEEGGEPGRFGIREERSLRF